MATVKQILDRKGRRIWFVRRNATVFEALELLAEKNIGALLVLDDQGGLAGIFSERDYARKVILHGKSSKTLPVSQVMTNVVVTIREDQTLEEAMEAMTFGHLRHLPVMRSGTIVGVISIGDVVKHIISEQQFAIQQLESYIQQS